MELVIEAFGEQEMSRRLLRFSHNAANMRPAFDEVHQEFLELERKQFESQGSLSGGWAPLAPTTLAAKQRLGIDQRILYGKTGNLFASLTESSSSGAVYEASADRAFMGSSVAYGVFHHSRAPRTKLPRRPLVELSNAVKVGWMKILQRHLVGGE